MNIKEKQELQEKIKQVKKELSSLEDELDRNENPFDVDDGDLGYYDLGYYSKGFKNIVFSHDWSDDDLKIYMPCKSKEIIKERQKRNELNALLEKFAYENNANVTEDMWKNEETKFHIYKQYFNNTFTYSLAIGTAYQELSTIYFISKEVAERAITEIVIPFMEDKK